jgi:hypothetical protein
MKEITSTLLTAPIPGFRSVAMGSDRPASKEKKGGPEPTFLCTLSYMSFLFFYAASAAELRMHSH